MGVASSVALARWFGTVAPVMYTGMGVQDSISCHRFVNTKPPPKVMAKQWLHLYQCGPEWVRPCVAAGVISNAYLAWVSINFPQRALYITAATLIGSILPITFLYFEPGINGAAKWKVQNMLRDEGFSMPPGSAIPSPYRHSASESAKVWAEKADVTDLVVAWSNRNIGRCIIATLAALLSGYATLCL